MRTVYANNRQEMSDAIYEAKDYRKTVIILSHAPSFEVTIYGDGGSDRVKMIDKIAGKVSRSPEKLWIK